MEAHITTVDAALRLASQQRDVAISMAREVATGQYAVLHQYEQQVERQRVEQTAQSDRANSMFLEAERQVFPLKDWFRMQRLTSRSMHRYSLVQF